MSARGRSGPGWKGVVPHLFGTTLLFSILSLAAADLWQDHNPYSAYGSLRAGTLLKLSVDEPFEILYEYDQDLEDKVTIKMQPDRKLTDFLPPVDSDKTSTKKGRVRIRARSRLQLKVAVAVERVLDSDVVEFSGTRVLSYEANRATQRLQVRGRVHLGDVSADRNILSHNVADLQLVLSGAPERPSRELPMKTKTGEPGEPPVPSAQLNEREKQQLLLEYLNRILGETDDK